MMNKFSNFKFSNFSQFLVWVILSFTIASFIFNNLPEYSKSAYRPTIVTHPMEKLGADFTANYVAANSIREGLNPYKNNARFGSRFVNPYLSREWPVYVYPIIGAYFFIPLSFFSIALAYKLWIIISLILLLLSIIYLVQIFPSKLLVFTTLVTISFLSYPLLFALERGISDIIILFLLCIAFYYQVKGRNDWITALTISMSILIKLYPGIFLLYFVIRRKWGLVKKILLFLFILTFSTFNLGLLKDSFTSIQNFSTKPTIWIGNHSLISFLSLNRWSETFLLPVSFFIILSMTGTTFYFAYKRRQKDNLFDFLEWGICFILMTIIPSVSHDYNLILQIFTVAGIFYYFRTIKNFRRKNLFLAVSSILLISTLFAPTFIVFANPFLSNKFPILFLLWILLFYLHLDKQAESI